MMSPRGVRYRSWLSSWYRSTFGRRRSPGPASDLNVLVRAVHPLDPTVGQDDSRRVWSSQVMSKRICRERIAVLFPGCSTNLMPLAIVSRTDGVPTARSARMLCTRYGKASSMCCSNSPAVRLSAFPASRVAANLPIPSQSSARPCQATDFHEEGELAPGGLHLGDVPLPADRVAILCRAVDRRIPAPTSSVPCWQIFHANRLPGRLA